MIEFMNFFNEKRENFPMHMEIYYSKIVDWSINIWLKGLGPNGTDIRVINVTDIDMDLCFAKAHVELKQWFIDNQGGY